MRARPDACERGRGYAEASRHRQQRADRRDTRPACELAAPGAGVICQRQCGLDIAGIAGKALAKPLLNVSHD
jgi:hypothetical protein